LEFGLADEFEQDGGSFVLTGGMVVATPWYPSAEQPYAGSFVREWIKAAELDPGQVTIIHLENTPTNDDASITRCDTAEGELWRLRVPVDVQRPRAEVARAQLDALSPELLAVIRQAGVVMCHVAMPTGWAVCQVLDSSQRLVLVEHASYVPQLVDHPEASQMLNQVLERASVVLTAGESTAATLRQAIGRPSDRIWAVGNPLSSQDFGYVAHESARLDRWLYVGNLLASKGVLHLGEAFSRYAKTHPNAELTLVGEGAEMAALKSMLRRRGLLHRVHFAQGKDRRGVGAAMAEADLLVHLSMGETFGLAPLEGLLSGLPVVTTQTEGAKQTMGPAVRAGRAALVPVRGGAGGAKLVVAAVESLAAGLANSAARAQAVRQTVLERYGASGFGALVRRALGGQTPYPACRGDNLVVIALTKQAAKVAQEPIRQALWQGRRVVLATASSQDLIEQDPRVQCLDLSRQGRALAGLDFARRVVAFGLRLPMALVGWVCLPLEKLHLPKAAGMSRLMARGSRGVTARFNDRAEPLTQGWSWRGRRRERLVEAAVGGVSGLAGPPALAADQILTFGQDPARVSAAIATALGPQAGPAA